MIASALQLWNLDCESLPGAREDGARALHRDVCDCAGGVLCIGARKRVPWLRAARDWLQEAGQNTALV